MRKFLSSLIFFSIILVACGDKQENVETTKEQFLYKNKDFGISVLDTEGWEIDEEVMEEYFNLSFKNNNSTVILTSLQTSKSFKEIKEELLLGAGDITIIKDEEDFLSYESNLNNRITTDIYLQKNNKFTYLIIYKTPSTEYSKNEKDFHDLLDNIQLN